MMSNICLKSEKLKCSIGCFVGSAGKGSGPANVNNAIEKRTFLDELCFKPLHPKSTTNHRSIKCRK